ncbi:MAG: MFS transporter [Promethearchaeota archaeon]|jgi:MFS family permease
MTKKNSSKLIEFTVYMINTIGPLTGNVLMIILGTLSVEFSVSPSDLLIIIPIMTFPNAIIQLFSGALSDVKGRIPVVLSGLSTLCCSMIIAGLSTSFLMYSLSGLLWGIGLAFINPCLIALLTDITPDLEKLPKKIANRNAFANVGSAIGPIIVGFIVLLSWRLLYVFYAIFVAIFICVTIFIPKPSHESNKDVKFTAVFHDISKEIRRSIVILLMISGFLFSLSYASQYLLTITELTGTVTETAMGIIFCILGIVGALNAIFVGNFIEKKGIKFGLIYGMSVFLFMTVFLLLLGDITNTEVLIYAIFGLLFTGVVRSTLFTTFSYISQMLSKERRGTLAGLTTASLFIGISLGPTIFTPTYENLGITAIYQ